MPGSRLRRVLMRVGVSVVATGIGLLLLEIALRFFPAYAPRPYFVVASDSTEPSRFVPDAAIGWKMRPNLTVIDGATVSTNDTGFRSRRPFVFSERPIVVVGDSFTYGSGVNDGENFADFLESIAGRPTANLGIPGFGVDQILLALRHYGLPLRPALIVVGVVEVDFERSQTWFDPGKGFRRPSFELNGDRLVRRASDAEPSWVVRTLDQRSRVWRAWRLVLQTIGHRYAVGDWWHLNAALLRQMHADAGSAGVPILFVMLPTPEWRSFPALRAFFRDLGASHLDLIEDLRSESAGFHGTNLHPSVRGHRLIADRIADWIRRNQLPKSE